LHCFPVSSHACGYDWIGECSSSIHLRINGTTDSFNIAACPSGINYHGLYLGQLQTLSLANAKAITWESCQNNVTNISLKYRLYEEGGGAGSFQDYPLVEDFSKLEGPYTTRYWSKPGNIDLTAGLSIGKTYVLEVYMVAQVDTIGDDFVPETQLLKNNNGQYYRVSFTYGGPDAAPFVAIPTAIREPKCYGDSNGMIRISVWGEQTGLYYQWSNIPLNYHQQENLPAGNYSITVTGANHAAYLEIPLSQPLPLDSTLLSPLPDQVLVTCNQPATSICAVSQPDAIYQWYKDGVPTLNTPCANAAAGGIYRLEVSWQGCTASKDVIAEEHLVDPIVKISGIIKLGCFNSSIPVVLKAQTQAFNPTFSWIWNGQVISTADSCQFTITEFQQTPQGLWVPVVPELFITDGYGCMGQATLAIVLVNPSFPLIWGDETPPSAPNASDGAIALQVEGGAPPYSALWSNGASDFTISGLTAGTYCVTVTDQNQCSNATCFTLIPLSASLEPGMSSIVVYPNPIRANEPFWISIRQELATSVTGVRLLASDGRFLKSLLLEHSNVGTDWSIDHDLPHGVFVLQVMLKKGVLQKKIAVLGDN
jgi:hypothetical protein